VFAKRLRMLIPGLWPRHETGRRKPGVSLRAIPSRGTPAWV